jgi:tryptophan synthase alpha chain
MTLLAPAFAKGHPAFVCFITAGDGDIVSNPDAPADAPSATLW